MNVPNHIAIILDGNGRWAKERGMPRTYGHVKGCANLENICYDIKVNWTLMCSGQRPPRTPT